jgi:hypothetical protein
MVPPIVFAKKSILTRDAPTIVLIWLIFSYIVLCIHGQENLKEGERNS